MKKITLIIDGWTGTHDKEAIRFHKAYAGDDILKKKIISRLPSTVKVISLIGALAEEKINIASMVDFFISNHATGSIWVSRIAKSYGVTHISNSARESSERQHIHWNSSLVPKELIQDINAEDAQTPFHVSYGVNQEEFLKYVLSKLKTINK